jgi:Spy/CpxP family protein refolding chaperone
MKRKILFSLIAALVLIAGAALAGDTFQKIHVRGPHMMAFEHGAELAEKLGLSAEQKESAKELHEELMAKAHPVMEQHHQQMEEIHSLLDAGNANATEIGQKMIAAHATRKQLEAIHEEGFERFASQLTEEQKAKLEELKKEHPFPHRGMRMRIHH